MLKDIEIKCDRCKCFVKGFNSVSQDGETIATAGYYRGDGQWKKYIREGEKNICENCMFDNEQYRKDQGITERSLIGMNEP